MKNMPKKFTIKIEISYNFMNFFKQKKISRESERFFNIKHIILIIHVLHYFRQIFVRHFFHFF